jgi:hypothetical protein
VVPTQRAEGANDPPLPVNSFFVAPNVWTKFSIRHPVVSYSEFLSYRVKRYQLRNCDNPPRKVPYYRLRPIHFGH